MWLLTSDEMRAADHGTIAGLGVPGVCLMELAGAGAARWLLEAGRARPGEPVAVLCGGGNNGGDGFVLARHVANAGLRPTIFLLAARERVVGDARVNLDAALRLGLPVRDAPTAAAVEALGAELGGPRLRVDALLGTGLSREPQGAPAAGIALLNRPARAPASHSPTFTLAIDLPSGLHADDGWPLGEAVRADLTVTFGAWKRAHFLQPGPSYCGVRELVDIGIPPGVIADIAPGMRLLEESQVRDLLPPRPLDCHKGDFGRVLVLAGSPGMAGAGLLAAAGALRAGAGVVTLATSPEGQAAAQARFPSLLTRPLAEAALLDPVAAGAPYAAVALGPGLGLTAAAAALVERWAVGCTRPLVLDADALTLLAAADAAALLRGAAGPRILTPHEGELARLLGVSREQVHRQRAASVAQAAARFGCTVLLKGRGTLVADPAVPCLTLVDRGHPAQATGGSGDVLTGTIAGLCGQGLAALPAAEVGAWLHGRAGELAAAEIGPAGIMAEDLAARLPGARPGPSPAGETS